MDNATTERIADSEVTANASESSAVLKENESTSPESQPAIRYASDTEVDAAMEKIFQKHDRLFSELAK